MNIFRHSMFACAVVLALGAPRAGAANPLGIAFKDTTNVALYGQPGGMLIAGRCNRNDPAFADARHKGAEVLLYIAPAERPDTRVCALDNEFYMNELSRVPLWPYPHEGERVSYPKTHMTDMRPGSPWILHVVDYVTQLMRDGKVDGVFLDALGARPWNKQAMWELWPQKEKDEWTDGAIDLVRRLDEKRRAINPDFLIVSNGPWDRGDSRGQAGERYVDGIMLEHPKLGSKWHEKQAGESFGDLGHRRVLVVASGPDDARAWAKVKGVTHVCSQVGKGEYVHPTEPAVAFEPLHDRKSVASR
ncbi:hypothetical protein [Peristeroidobacter soli]|jgi:hypothetical protein|uniref:hypothetical protein n=1 Tax=Peristeroidobacter soli TaxID=2497877 RepID=UPI00101DF5F9|nr:hypothetical protein [Peristeroidobacter soli]